MVKRSMFLVVLLVALQTALATAYPLTIRDRLGAKLTLTGPPSRRDRDGRGSTP